MRKPYLLAAVAVSALMPMLASAQSMPGMSGMDHMHMHSGSTPPATPKPPVKSKTVARPVPRPAATGATSPDAVPTNAASHDHAPHDHAGMAMPPVPEPTATPATSQADPSMTPGIDAAAHSGADPSAPEADAHGHHMPGMTDMHDIPDMADMHGMDHAAHAHHAMKSAFGPYPGNRDASGTSWQPDASPHAGIHGSRSGWDLMLHGTVNVVYSNQSGPRGDQKGFVLGHIMGSATRALSPRDRLQIRVAVTPDPFMGPRGYPLLFATGETADGRTQLIDRQHPHDLVSELSVAVSHRFSDRISAYLFYGQVGDPAFGPPAYVHRLSIQDDPEAPISHHWLDSMHGTQGVITGGLVMGNVKVELSGFRGREPDQHRYDIEAPKIDSIATRLSWNPTRTLALQVSYAFQRSPEQVTPDQNQQRYSASAIYTRAIGTNGYWSTTFAWGRRVDRESGVPSESLDAFVLESAVHPDDRWTVFARGERVDNDELLPPVGAFHGDAFTVGKVSVGAIRDFRLVPHLKMGLGGLVSRTFVPDGLATAYGGDRWSGQAFLRFKID